MNTQELIRESQRWLDIISAPELTEEQKARIQADTVDNFRFYYNRGYLEYRKSVIERAASSRPSSGAASGSTSRTSPAARTSTASAATASTARASTIPRSCAR